MHALGKVLLELPVLVFPACVAPASLIRTEQNAPCAASAQVKGGQTATSAANAAAQAIGTAVAQAYASASGSVSVTGAGSGTANAGAVAASTAQVPVNGTHAKILGGPHHPDHHYQGNSLCCRQVLQPSRMPSQRCVQVEIDWQNQGMGLHA